MKAFPGRCWLMNYPFMNPGMGKQEEDKGITACRREAKMGFEGKPEEKGLSTRYDSTAYEMDHILPIVDRIRMLGASSRVAQTSSKIAQS
jgi:hypothetical protein